MIRNNITAEEMLIKDTRVQALMSEAGLPKIQESIDTLQKGMSILQSQLVKEGEIFNATFDNLDTYKKMIGEFSQMHLSRIELQHKYHTKLNEILELRKSELNIQAPQTIEFANK